MQGSYESKLIFHAHYADVAYTSFGFYNNHLGLPVELLTTGFLHGAPMACGHISRAVSTFPSITSAISPFPATPSVSLPLTARGAATSQSRP